MNIKKIFIYKGNLSICFLDTTAYFMIFDFDKLNEDFSRHYDEDIEPGKLLISSPILRDNNFKKTVVLICDVDKEGVFGLTLNRVLQMNLSDAFNEVSGWDCPLYFGGPAHGNALSYIHNQYEEVKGSRSIVSGLAWGGDFDDLEETINDKNNTDVAYKFFVGYSGWRDGQLEAEIQDKYWFVCNFRKELIFEGEGGDVWDKAVAGLGGQYELLLKYPEYPHLN